jgi:hypothetical protein
MEYTIQQAKDEAVKYCTKDFPVDTSEYDGAGGSMCYIRKDIAEKMAELYASKLREADQERIKDLEGKLKLAVDLVSDILKEALVHPGVTIEQKKNIIEALNL